MCLLHKTLSLAGMAKSVNPDLISNLGLHCLICNLSKNLFYEIKDNHNILKQPVTERYS